MNEAHKNNWRPGPEVPRAHHVQYGMCDDPNCGLHAIAYDENDAPMIEIVSSREQTEILVGYIVHALGYKIP